MAGSEGVYPCYYGQALGDCEPSTWCYPWCPLATREGLLRPDCAGDDRQSDSPGDGRGGLFGGTVERGPGNDGGDLSSGGGSGHPTGARGKSLGKGVSRFHMSEDVVRQ